jgi:hypothetical protein
MHILIWLYDEFLWIHSLTRQYMHCKYIWAISIPMNSTKALLVLGWEREGTPKICLKPKILHILRGEIRHNLSNALVRIHKYHILRELWESYLRNSEFYLQTFMKTPR